MLWISVFCQPSYVAHAVDVLHLDDGDVFTMCGAKHEKPNVYTTQPDVMGEVLCSECKAALENAT